MKRLACAVLRNNGYQWDEIVKSLFDIYLCGSDRYRGHYFPPCLVLVKPPGSHVPNSDTIGRGIKQLATDNITYTAKSGNTYAFQHQRASERPADETQHGVGLFKWSVPGWTLTINSFHGNTMPHTPAKKAFGYFPVWQAWAVLSSM